ncbi:hypothetical protein Vafri_18266, partial [Volvox africanus]
MGAFDFIFSPFALPPHLEFQPSPPPTQPLTHPYFPPPPLLLPDNSPPHTHTHRPPSLTVSSPARSPGARRVSESSPRPPAPASAARASVVWRSNSGCRRLYSFTSSSET